MRRAILRTARFLAFGLAAFTLACGEPANGGRGADRDVAMNSPTRMPPAPPQTIDLRGVGYDQGAPAAPITIIEFSDFGCPYCGLFARETYPELYKEFIATGKVQWKYVPFVLGIFPNGDRAALAAECAGEQGDKAFWAMHDRLYEGQSEWKSVGGNARGLFERYAKELKLDANRFMACYDQDRGGERVRVNSTIGRQLGVRATPTFFVNGMRVEGAIPLEIFQMALREMLAEIE